MGIRSEELPRAMSFKRRLESSQVLQLSFTGIGSFAHLDYVKCLTHPTEAFDIAILGVPFDTAVSYRPGG